MSIRQSDKKKKLRELMKEKKAGKNVPLKNLKKIDSPLAMYDKLGKLYCKLCKIEIKSDNLWDAHCKTKKHKLIVLTLLKKKKEQKAKKEQEERDRQLMPPPSSFGSSSSSSSSSDKKEENDVTMEETNNKEENMFGKFIIEEEEEEEETKKLSKEDIARIEAEIFQDSGQVPISFFQEQNENEEEDDDTNKKTVPNTFFDSKSKKKGKKKDISNDVIEEEFSKFKDILEQDEIYSKQLELELASDDFAEQENQIKQMIKEEEWEKQKEIEKLQLYKSHFKNINNLKNKMLNQSSENGNNEKKEDDEDNQKDNNKQEENENEKEDDDEEEEEEEEDVEDSLFNWRSKSAF
eukprot:TRINITY_DN5216_c2_g1_i1.p1 TRINITY_DN5216_c2_g1~~TRINITY_DN5216_c2_g1_i1.p1  ORF type:complete len:350 (+),score=171.87 TRINITY_DN5216_c2_g1_i1:23-1072(+)